VTWATGGMGANLIGGTVTTTTTTAAGVVTTTTTTTLAGTMANAAFSSLAAQASITLVNNKGDIAKTLQDMSNSSTIKATLAAVLTAGVLDKLGTTSTMTELSRSGGFADKLTYNLINATGRALTSTAINGGDLQGALKSALVGGLVDTAQGQAASLIGQSGADYLSHKLAHALVGCVAGAAAGGACKDGAIGGAIGEVVAEMFKDQRPGIFASDAEKQAFNAKVLATSKLVSGAVAAYAGGNAHTAITTAEVAVANNFLSVNRQNSRASQWGSFKQELDSCKVTAGCDVSGVYNRWTAISNDQQRQAMGSMDALFAAIPSEASAAGQWFGKAISSMYMDPRDVCSTGDNRCIGFVQSQQNQAMAVYRSGLTVAYANDLIDGGGRVRSGVLETPTGVSKSSVLKAELDASAGGAANIASSARLQLQLAAEQAAGTRAPTFIAGYSDHAAKQIFGRDGGIGVSNFAVKEAFDSPASIQYVPSAYGPTFKYIGRDATVVLNTEGKVVTAWANNSAGTRK
jgi:hypothetical protein